MPYIGITGFTKREEVDAILESVPENSKRPVMIGVLASSKTLKGRKNKWPGRFPKVGDISGIFQNHPKVLNLIHYSTDSPDQLYRQLIGLTAVGGENLHGFQLNIAWPLPKILREYRKRHPEKKMVLQVGKKALGELDYSPKDLVIEIKGYNGLIEYILLDVSGGFGIPLNSDEILRYLDVLMSKDFGIGIGVAGGLCADTFNLIQPIIEKFPDISIDAEGKLRDSDDELNLHKAKTYLTKAFTIFDSSCQISDPPSTYEQRLSCQ